MLRRSMDAAAAAGRKEEDCTHLMGKINLDINHADVLRASALTFNTFSSGVSGSAPSLLPPACGYLPLEPPCSPAGPDTPALMDRPVSG